MEEIWDLYDICRRPTGRTQPRSRAVTYGDYHLVVFGWVVDPNGRVLMSMRAPNKSYGGFYECTGGCAYAGESPVEAAAREVREETGIAVSAAEAIHVRTIRRLDDFADTFFFLRDHTACEMHPQEGETSVLQWFTPEEYDDLCAAGRVVPSAMQFRTLLRAFEAGQPILENLCEGTQMDLTVPGK